MLTFMGAMLFSCAGVVLAQATTPPAGQETTSSGNQGSAQAPSGQTAPPLTGTPRRVCSDATDVGMVRCHAVRLDNPKRAVSNGGGGTGTAVPSVSGSGPSGGYSPADLQLAYNLSGAGGTGTIAIVDSYDDPNAESDLKTYRAQFGLDPCTSTANGGNRCFTKVDQNGGTGHPSADGSWAQEISLDLDMASAICPSCNILLVEANSADLGDLGVAVDTAARLGANAISNGYGNSEFSGETGYESHYNHPGIAVTVSSGDSGYGVDFPASSQYVTAVGGTTLNKASNTGGWSESVWSGTGSGCSAYIPKPPWQQDAGCPMRTVADVAAVADPQSGVSVYDTYNDANGAGTGWMVFGGTSVGAPIIAATYVLAGDNYSNSYPYEHTSSLNDIVSGSNGNCTTGAAGADVSSSGMAASPTARGHHRGGKHHKHRRRGARRHHHPSQPGPSPSDAYLCTGVPGYDGPSGNGTPNGWGAF